MLSANPLMDMGVLFVLLGPLYVRWPILLLPILGTIAATVVSPEWTSSLQQFTVPAILVSLSGYVVAAVAKAAGSI